MDGNIRFQFSFQIFARVISYNYFRNEVSPSELIVDKKNQSFKKKLLAQQL